MFSFQETSCQYSGSSESDINLHKKAHPKLQWALTEIKQTQNALQTFTISDVIKLTAPTEPRQTTSSPIFY